MSINNGDLINSQKFSTANYHIRLLRAVYKKVPNVASELSVKIRNATDNDFFIPNSLKHCAHIVDISVTENMCNMMSCNQFKSNSMCGENEAISVYRIGDTNQYDYSCQPACSKFEITPPRLHWHQNQCKIVPNKFVQFEHPFYRSDIKYEYRKNDLPTGFSRIETDETFSGYNYLLNKTYCGYFDMLYEENKNCYSTWYNKYIVDPLLGGALWKNIGSGIHTVISNKPYPEPSSLPPLLLPSSSGYKDYHTLDGWSKHLNGDFKLPELFEIKPIKLNDRGVVVDDDDDDDYLDRSKEKTINLHRINIDTASSVIDVILNLISNPDFLINLGTEAILDISLIQFKKMCLELVERLSGNMAKELVNLTGKIGYKILNAAISSASMRVMITTVAAQMAIQIAKFAATTATVIGWVLVGIFVLDIVFTFWDPFGYNNIISQEMINNAVKNLENDTLLKYNLKNFNYNFFSLVNFVLTQDELEEIGIKSIIEEAIYLNELEVNSFGVVIDKGEIINLDDFVEPLIINRKSLARRVAFDAQEYKIYNKTFLERASVNGIFSNIIYILSFMVLTTFILRFIYIAVILFLLLIILVVISTNQVVEVSAQHGSYFKKKY